MRLGLFPRQGMLRSCRATYRARTETLGEKRDRRQRQAGGGSFGRPNDASRAQAAKQRVIPWHISGEIDMSPSHISGAKLTRCLPLDNFLMSLHNDLELCGRCRVTRKVNEVVVQFKVSPKIKKAIKAMAFERDETVRSLILQALKDNGLPISEDELGDRRRSSER